MSRINIEQMEKEEKELEEYLTSRQGGDTTKPTEDAGDNKPISKDSEQDTTELVTQEPEPSKETPVEPEREDWEKRYKNLRASRDENLWKAKQDLANAMERIQSLQRDISELKAKAPSSSVDPFEGIFTEEDEDTLGPATLATMKKVTQKATEVATAPLRKELEDERQRRQKSDAEMVKRLKQENYSAFLGKIASAEPEWKAINFDPGFLKYMQEPDYDGIPRKTYFSEAEAQGNAALVIRYMKEYKQWKSGVKPKADPLASKVAPTGEGSGSNAVPKEKVPENISRAYIDKFYSDLTRGKYKGRHSEAEAIEAKIEKAVMEGRVVR
jgi:hypothetical protein